MRIHVDTDIAGDPDDVAALCYLLARPDVELTGVTTVDDPGGLRAGYAVEVLRMAGRHDVRVAAGAEVSSATGRPSGGPPPGDRHYWPTAVRPRPGPLEAAVDLLARSVAAGAVVLGIGPATTLAAAERARSGLLAGTHVVLMAASWHLRRPACRSGRQQTTGTSSATSQPPSRYAGRPAGSPSYPLRRPRRPTSVPVSCPGCGRSAHSAS